MYEKHPRLIRLFKGLKLPTHEAGAQSEPALSYNVEVFN